MYSCLTSGGAVTLCPRTNKLYIGTSNAIHIFTIGHQQDVTAAESNKQQQHKENKAVGGDLTIESASHHTFPMPSELQAINYGEFGLAVFGGHLWLIGGHNKRAEFEVEALDCLWSMDTENGTWEQKQSMLEKRAKMAVVENGKKPYKNITFEFFPSLISYVFSCRWFIVCYWWLQRLPPLFW